jgi:hypothetical protein
MKHLDELLEYVKDTMTKPDYQAYATKMEAWRDDIRHAVENNELPMREFIVSKEFDLKEGQWASNTAYPMLVNPWTANVQYEFPNGCKATLVSGTQYQCGADTPWCLYIRPYDLVGLSVSEHFLTEDKAVIELARIMAMPPLHAPLKT